MSDKDFEHRSWVRKSVKHPVSFKYLYDKGPGMNWYFGDIIDISVHGLRVAPHAYEARPQATGVMLLCLPEKTGLNLFDQKADPLRITTKIIWQDRDKGVFGLGIVH